MDLTFKCVKHFSLKGQVLTLGLNSEAKGEDFSGFFSSSLAAGAGSALAEASRVAALEASVFRGKQTEILITTQSTT